MLMFKKNSLLKIFCVFLCFLFTPITKAYDEYYAKVVLLGEIGSGKTTLHTLLGCADCKSDYWSEKKEVNMFPKHTINISVQTETKNDYRDLNFDNKEDSTNIFGDPVGYDRFNPYQSNISCSDITFFSPQTIEESNQNKQRINNLKIELENKESAEEKEKIQKEINSLINRGSGSWAFCRIKYLLYDTTAEKIHEKFIDEFCNNAHAIFLCVNAEDFIDRQNGKLYFQESEDFYKLLRKIPKIAPKSKVIIFLTQLGNIKNASNELKGQIKNFIENIKNQDEFKDYVHSSFDFTLDYSEPDAQKAFKSSFSYGSYRNKYTKMFISTDGTGHLWLEPKFKLQELEILKKEPRLNGLLASLIVEHGIDYFPKTPKGFSSFITKEEKKYVETVDNNDCTGSKSTRTRKKNEYKLKVIKNVDEE